MVGSFFLLGIAFLLAGAVAALVNGVHEWTWGRWLALHLCFVGGISSLILGASQFFAGAFLSSDPPSRPLIRAQVGCWGAGSLALAVAVPLDLTALIVAAVVLLLTGLGLYGAALRRMARDSLQTIPWATRWYLAAAAIFAVGIVAGVALALRAPWSDGDLLSAHITLNVAGWLGTAIVGTMHTFYPSLARVRLPAPRLQAVTYVGWVGGVVALALGYAFALGGLALAGWLALTIAAGALLVNVAGCRRSAPRPIVLPARLLGLAQLFLFAGLLLAGWRALGGEALTLPIGADRAAIGTLLIAGWVGLTVAGSLLHLLAVVLRVRNFRTPMPMPRSRTDGAVTAIAAIGVSAVAVEQILEAEPLGALSSAVLLAAYLILGYRVVALAARVLTRARPSI